MSERGRIAVFDDAQKAERDYWVKRLAGTADREAAVALDHERPAGRGGDYGQVAIAVTGGTAAQLLELTKGSLLLLYTALLAALEACLWLAGGTLEERVAVGSPPRRKEGEEPPPPNALAIVDRLHPAQSFRQRLIAVRAILLEAYDRQGYPHGRLLRDLGLGQVRNRCPLFDIAFCFAGLHGELAECGCDLTLRLAAEAAGIAGVLEYRRDLFDRATAERFAAHFLAVACAATADLDLPLASLDALSAAERHQLLREWGQGPAAAASSSVLTLLAAAAGRGPNLIALDDETVALSYSQLERRVEELARRLLDLGVGPEVRVGILAERSPEMVVALLAVLRAGGAYLPLDPAWPPARLELVLSDAAAALVLAQPGLAARLPAGTHGVPLAPVAPVASVAPVAPVAPVGPAVAPAAPERAADGGVPPAGWPLERLVYVIYTSGSSGTPKAVGVTDSGLANLAAAQAAAFGLGPGSRVLQFAALGFDASVSEIFATLVSGATLCLAGADELVSAEALTALLRRRAITCVTLPPPLLALMAPQGLPALATVVAAGEACPAEVAAAWSPGRRFIDAYGPTETTVCATWTVVDEAAAPPPIGRPLAGARAYLLDARLQPAASGQPGELYLGGAGVARGYLGRPELTAASFVPDPWGGGAGDRLYRSGDRARTLPDGRLLFLGRGDHQVKVRGYRIEPGEVEAALRRHPQVADAVVVGRAGAGGSRLVAYCVPAPGAPPAWGELRGWLQERLPAYMVPEVLVPLAALPLTANGKVDRRALPAPDRSRPELAVPYLAPRTQLESALASIWSDLLDLEQIGANDSFFELGGNSLLVTQAISRVRAALHVDLDLARVMRAPTIAAMAAIVLERQAGGAAASETAAGPLQGQSIDQQLAELELLADADLDAPEPGDLPAVAEPHAGGGEGAR
jgi:amino acid adenylation domain-containing protein